MNDSCLKPATVTNTGGTGTPKKTYTTRNLSTALQAVGIKAEQPRKFHLRALQAGRSSFSEVLHMFESEAWLGVSTDALCANVLSGAPISDATRLTVIPNKVAVKPQVSHMTIFALQMVSFPHGCHTIVS